MSFVIDSNSPYFTEFPLNTSKNAVYLTAEDNNIGPIMAVIYKSQLKAPKLSAIFLAAHGTSGFVNMTLEPVSKFFGACKNLAPSHANSPVRKALAVAALRTYSTCDKPLRKKLYGYYDESYAGALGSSFRLICGKFPQTIGERILANGLLSAKHISTANVDVIYEDQEQTIDLNNELVYLMGEQLDLLMDELTEYKPEPTDKLYLPLDTSAGLETEHKSVQDACEEFYLLQASIWNELLELLQKTIIPLRLEVLRGSFPDLTIAKLNQVFPPTIDELYRINNVFYEALKTALPLGAFEVLRASGITIPYFYRALMRHVAATKNFSELLKELVQSFPEVSTFLKTEHGDIESIVCGKDKLIELSRLLNNVFKTKEHDWMANPEEREHALEFKQAASSVFEPFLSSVDSGMAKFVKEMVINWPRELVQISPSRRLISVFEATDLIEPNDDVKLLNNIFVVFGDAVLILRPENYIPKVTPNGLHKPQISDVLMNLMINDADIDIKDLPKFKVIGWSFLLDINFASFNDPQNLYVFGPSIMGSYKLVGDQLADNLVSLLAKTKISTKCEPFYLFKLEGKQINLLAAVHEIKSYTKEISKSKVAVFLSKKISDTLFHKYDLFGAISVNFDREDHNVVRLDVRTRQGYKSSVKTSREDLQLCLANEIAYLSTLSLSSQNEQMLDSIVEGNKRIAKKLLEWAQQPEASKLEAKEQKNTKNVLSSAAQSRAAAVQTATPTASTQTAEAKHKGADSGAASQANTDKRSSYASTGPIQHGVEIFANLNNGPSGQHSIAESSAISSSYVTEDDLGDANEPSEYSSFQEDGGQKHVDDWLHQLKRNREDVASLSSNDESFGMKNDAFSWTSVSSHNSDLQIGGFLDRSSSSLYNSNAGSNFPRLDSQSGTHKQLIDDEPDPSKIGNEDFSYLASLVEHSDRTSRSSSMVFPSFNERPVVRDGSMIFGSKNSIPKSNSNVSTNSQNQNGGSAVSRSSSHEPLQVSRSLRYLSTIVDEPVEEQQQEEAAKLEASKRQSVSELSETERSQQIAKDWLAWTKSRPSSMLPPPESPRKSKTESQIQHSESSKSFRKMVMSSSLHTLQLASFIAQIDQKKATTNDEVAADLDRVKDDLTHIYKLSETSEALELVIRKRLCGIHQLFLHYDLLGLANGLLEIEWMRRSRVIEKHGSIANELWKLNS